jgi:two-component system chemotaxis response regulator CheB
VIKLLVVDDSALMRRLLGTLFAQHNDFEVAFARDGLEALDRVNDFAPDVVTLDVNMPHMDGVACLNQIMLARPCPVVMLSSLTAAGAEVTLQAMALGAVDFVAKPSGAISLSMHEFGPRLVETVRTASRARVRCSLRLAERVRLRAGGGMARGPAPSARAPLPVAAAGVQARPPGPADGVVVVGCSTGGPPALDALLARLPADFPWPIMVAQHMPAAFTGALARRLDRLCALSVVEVTRPMKLAVGHVYVGKGEADMIVSPRPGGPVVTAAPSSDEYRWHPSVDRLVSSAMQHLGAARLIGVLMTGMGDDGAASMSRLRAEGGRTIAEAEETAVVWGMPGELVRAGGASWVVPLSKIAHRLQRLVPAHANRT